MDYTKLSTGILILILLIVTIVSGFQFYLILSYQVVDNREVDVNQIEDYFYKNALDKVDANKDQIIYYPNSDN